MPLGLRSSLLLLGVLVSATACQLLSPPDTAPAAIDLTAAANTIAAGASTQVTAVVRNKAGTALSGKSVTFSSSNQSVITVSASGLVTAVGPTGTANVSAQCEGVTSSQTIAMSVVAANPSAIVKVGTDPATVVAGFRVADSVRVRVTDAYGNARPGVTVTFAVSAGGGTLSPTSATTDAAGYAAATFTTGPVAATNTATATVAGLTPVVFSYATIPNVGAIRLNTAALPSGAGGILGSWIDPAGNSHDFRLDTPGVPLTLSNLTPGGYTINWPVPYCGLQGGCGQVVSWGPSTATQRITVVASTTPIDATMTYLPTTGILRFSVPSLPSPLYGTARVVMGLNTRTVTIGAGSTQDINDVPPGAYTISWFTADCGLQGGCGNAVTWGPQSTTQTVTVAASVDPKAAAMTYEPKTGVIRLSVSGIPSTGLEGGNSAVMTLNIGDGRADSRWMLNGGTLDINNVPPGTYILLWGDSYCGYQGGCGRAYAPMSYSQTIVVSAATTPVIAAMIYR